MVSTRLFKRELEKYQDTLGSLINYNKSHILTWNCNPRDLADISRILGITRKSQWDVFKYLGAPIFRATLKSSSWLPLVEKIKSKISTWGASLLNPIRKVILIKAVLSSTPIYQCSILLAPNGLLARLEILLKKFIWKGEKHNENNLCLVKWEKVSKPWSHAGL